MFFLRLTIEGLLFPLSTSQGKNKLEFVHITKNAGSSIENTAAKSDISWGALSLSAITSLSIHQTRS